MATRATARYVLWPGAWMRRPLKFSGDRKNNSRSGGGALARLPPATLFHAFGVKAIFIPRLWFRGSCPRVAAQPAVDQNLDFHASILRASRRSRIVCDRFVLPVTHRRDETPRGNLVIDRQVLDY